jgi:hypothetical protein
LTKQTPLCPSTIDTIALWLAASFALQPVVMTAIAQDWKTLFAGFALLAALFRDIWITDGRSKSIGAAQTERATPVQSSTAQRGGRLKPSDTGN